MTAENLSTAEDCRLSKEEINELPLFHYDGPVHLVQSENDLAFAMDAVSSEVLLGFDTETRPTFSKGKSYDPSLIQMACKEGVFLFHRKWTPLQALRGVLENPNIIKAGVAVHDDMRFLNKLFAFSPRGEIDLALVARKNRLQASGLRALAAHFLGVRISKGQQCSNWGNENLSPAQITYAATDAWVGRELYLKMKSAGFVMQV